jgi:hypothetical protein
MKKLAKKQTGGISPSQAKEAKRDSLYNAAKERTKARLEAMQSDTIPVRTKVTSTEVSKGPVKIKGRTGTVTISKADSSKPATIATKKMGGQTKKKK